MYIHIYIYIYIYIYPSAKDKNCTYSHWTEWSACAVSCGGGNLQRYRTIVQYPSGNGLRCKERTSQELPCNPRPCPQKVDCMWGMWSEYSACSVSCGGGQKSRTRTVEQIAENGGATCNRSVSMEVSGCNTQWCPSGARDCEFGAWNDWSQCDAECDGGRSHRSRVVMVEATEGGAACDGDLQIFRSCGTVPCRQNEVTVPCLWGDWTEWSACSALCNGHQDRNRAVAQFAMNGGSPCDGGERLVRGCNLESDECLAEEPVDCLFQPWSKWNVCSHECNGGQQSRIRDVQRHARNFGKPCTGVLMMTQPCNTEPCVGDVRIDCQWSKWGDWSACTKSCDGGQMTRHRSIDVEASGGGRGCPAAAAMQLRECNALACYGAMQVCGWSPWGSWDQCSRACGGGQQERSRQKQWVPIEDPAAAASSASAGDGTSPAIGQSRRLQSLSFSSNDNKCVGSQKVTRPCNVHACDDVILPQPCRFDEWSYWGPCSCEGLSERERDINEPARNGGLPCVGTTVEHRTCEVPDKCSQPRINCGFGEWSDWSECTASCNGGQRYHTRSVARHAEQFGEGCRGGLEEVQPCRTQSCLHSVDCAYTDWAPWSLCSHTCGGGQRSRDRAIYREAQHGGRVCSAASLSEVAVCSTNECVPGVYAKRDCTWTMWQPWAGCSVTCGVGMTSRLRKVAAEASHGGTPCQGVFEAFRNCTDGPCVTDSADCRWGDWSQWSVCSDKCTGHQDRTRNILVYANGTGKLCSGASREMHPCEGGKGETPLCSSGEETIDCVLASWGHWSDCSKFCGGGQMYKSRRVVQQAPGDGCGCGCGWPGRVTARLGPLADAGARRITSQGAPRSLGPHLGKGTSGVSTN